MSDQENTPSVEDGSTVDLMGIPEQWQAVLATAPAMARLPDMVANQYSEERMPAAALEEMRQHVKHGVILLHQLIGDKINTLFEHFDVHFGVGCELLMDDVEDAFERKAEAEQAADASGEAVDESQVETYTPAAICGRLFAYIAMEVYTRDRCDSVDDGYSLDEISGFVKNMDPMVVVGLIERIIDCVELGERDSAMSREEAYSVAYGYCLHLFEPDKRTTRH